MTSSLKSNPGAEVSSWTHSHWTRLRSILYQSDIFQVHPAENDKNGLNQYLKKVRALVETFFSRKQILWISHFCLQFKIRKYYSSSCYLEKTKRRETSLIVINLWKSLLYILYWKQQFKLLLTLNTCIVSMLLIWSLASLKE